MRQSATRATATPGRSRPQAKTSASRATTGPHVVHSRVNALVLGLIIFFLP